MQMIQYARAKTHDPMTFWEEIFAQKTITYAQFIIRRAVKFVQCSHLKHLYHGMGRWKWHQGQEGRQLLISLVNERLKLFFKIPLLHPQYNYQEAPKWTSSMDNQQ
jgi:hypothetical protein